MVTLSVIAILLTLGVVGFQNLIAHNRITSAANGLIAHLQLARSEAVKRRGRVTLCPSNDGAGCLSSLPSVWDTGYIVATLDSANNVAEVLRQTSREEMNGLRTTGTTRRFIFDGDGTAPAFGTVKLCDPRDNARIRLVRVNIVGRGYVMCSDPNAYTCPETCP
jgi:type IV fimbrial biogenesis protein FimT